MRGPPGNLSSQGENASSSSINNDPNALVGIPTVTSQQFLYPTSRIIAIEEEEEGEEDIDYSNDYAEGGGIVIDHSEADTTDAIPGPPLMHDPISAAETIMKRDKSWIFSSSKHSAVSSVGGSSTNSPTRSPRLLSRVFTSRSNSSLANAPTDILPVLPLSFANGTSDDRTKDELLHVVRHARRQSGDVVGSVNGTLEPATTRITYINGVVSSPDLVTMTEHSVHTQKSIKSAGAATTSGDATVASAGTSLHTGAVGILASRADLELPASEFAAGCSLLQQAALGNQEGMELILKENPGRVNFRDYDRRTAVRLSCAHLLVLGLSFQMLLNVFTFGSLHLHSFIAACCRFRRPFAYMQILD
jgi:hypothetical protein